jgi:acetyl-CoA carboxylase biotin carboxyl carrier protein
MQIDLEQLRELMKALGDHELSELTLVKGDERIVLKRGGVTVSAPAVTATAPVAARASGTVTAETTKAEDANVVYITSPFVGTFYRSSSPTSDAFVEVGRNILPGTVLCIVEAMKLMNEIESEIAGTILEVLVENGKPVEYGDRLFKVRKQ